MTDVLEMVARVALAGWVGEPDDLWDAPPVLGVVGDQLCLVEIDQSNREFVLRELVDHYDVGDRIVRCEVVLFGEAGGFFASSLNFFHDWPKSTADVPADVLVDSHYKAAFTKSGDEIAMTVRHALRPPTGPATRRFGFRADTYEAAISDLTQVSRRLRDELLLVAQARAPEKVASLRTALEHWPV